MIRALALVTTLLASAHTLAQDGPPPTTVRTDAARSQQVTIMRSVSGDLRAVKRAMVAAENEGRCNQLLVEAGDFVEAGDVIARLDATLAKLEVSRLGADLGAKEAMLNEREAALRQVVRDYERLRAADSEGSIGENEIEDAQITIEGAKARVKAAEADVASARAMLAHAEEVRDDLTIRAPFDGQVVAKTTEVGAWVSRGGSVVELVALDTIDAIVDVPERYVAPLARQGATIEIEVPALDEHYTSDDVTVIASGDELARTFPVRVRFENADALLKPGMSVRALVPTTRFEDAVTIHKDAVLRDDGGAFAYFDAGGQAMPMRFDIRWYVGDRVVISGARVQPGMRFVTEGNERLYPTAPIRDMNAPTPDDSASDTQGAAPSDSAG